MSILYITSTRLGDAILSTGLLNYLLNEYPDQGVTIACGPPAAKVFEAVPRLERLHVMEKRPRGGHWFSLWRATIGTRWKIIVDLRRSPSCWLLRGERKFVQPKAAGPMHRLDLIASTMNLPPQPPTVWTAPEHESRAESLMGQGRPVVAFGPGASWRAKTWPADRFAALAGLLLGPGGVLAGGRLLLVGSEDERAGIAPLYDSLPGDRIIDAMGLDVLSTYAALKRCDLFVGNDSAMMHLASATGRPTVGLFGPTQDVLYGPTGPNGLVVRTPESFEELVGAPDFDHRTAPSLMTGLKPETVAEAIRSRWYKGEPGRAVGAGQ